MLCAGFARVVGLWEATQVELHGHYSIERLHALQSYNTPKCSTARLVAVVLSTAIPCLVTIVLMDFIPLNPPSAGASHNYGFWFHSSLGLAICTFCFVVLTYKAIPTHRVLWWEVLFVTGLVTCGAQLAYFGLSLGIGFPVPFGSVLQSPVLLVLLVGSLTVTSARDVRNNPTAHASLRDWCKVSVLLMSILFVYPIFNYIFINAPPHGQTALSLLLTIIKIAYKNAIAKCIRVQSDMKAEIVNFHVEISNVLFTTFSMQNATSVITLVVLVLVDFLQACATLYEVHRAAERIDRLEDKMEEVRRRSHTGTGVLQKGIMDSSRLLLNDATPASVIHTASAVLSQPGIPDNVLASLRARSRHWQPDSSWGRSIRAPWRPRYSYTRRVSQIPDRVTPAGPPTASPPIELVLNARSTSSIVPTSSPAKMSRSTDESPIGVKAKYAESVLRLLYLVEFTVLTEFIEFVVPMLYGTLFMPLW
jgi:hypothetical protein